MTLEWKLAYSQGIVREWAIEPLLAPILSGDRSETVSAAFSPNGALIFIGSQDGSVVAFKTRTGAKSTHYVGHRWGVDTIMFSADGSLFLTAAKDGKARLWAVGGKQLRTFEAGVGGSLLAAALSPDGNFIAVIPATADKLGTIVVWNADGREVQRIEDEDVGPFTKSLAFSKEGSHLFACNAVGAIKIWNIASAAVVDQLDELPDALDVETASGNNKRIVRIDQSNNSRVELTDRDGAKRLLVSGGNSIISVRMSPDGGHVAIADAAGDIRLMAISEPQRQGDLTVWTYSLENTPGGKAPGSAAMVRFSPDGRLLAVGSEKGDTHLLDVAEGSAVAVLPGNALLTKMAFSPTNDRLVTVTSEGQARLWWVLSSAATYIAKSQALAPRCLSPEERKSAFLDTKQESWCLNAGKQAYDPRAPAFLKRPM